MNGRNSPNFKKGHAGIHGQPIWSKFLTADAGTHGQSSWSEFFRGMQGSTERRFGPFKENAENHEPSNRDPRIAESIRKQRSTDR